MSSSSPSSSSSFSLPDHYHQQTLIHSSDQLCSVHCNYCDTLLAVSVPSGSLFKTVTIRCGHCTNLLSVNMRGVLDLHSPQPSPYHQHPLIHMQPSSLLEEIISSGGGGRELPSLNTMNMMMMSHENNRNAIGSEQRGEHQIQTMMQIQHQRRVGDHKLSKHHTNLLAVNRPPEKRQRVPSAYNRFIKEEIQRIKAANPDISHREAFSAAAKNWAHFPHIHFGLMHEEQSQPVTKKPNILPCQPLQASDEVLIHNGMFAESKPWSFPLLKPT